MVFITGGAILLPACVKNTKPVSIELKNIKISAEQETLLAEITDTIIPSTDTPGAKDIGLHKFVLRMVDDCSEPEEQQAFLTGLSKFDEMVKQKADDSFLELNKAQRVQVITDLDKINSGDDKEEKQKSVNAFYSIVKNLTVRGYMTSEYVMTNQLYYKMVPGKFKGCVEIKDAKDFKTILG